MDIVGFEWVLSHAQEETGVATSEEAEKVLSDLRRVSEALRSFAEFEHDTEAIQKNIALLKKRREELFEKVRDLAVTALEEIKRKHRGEMSLFQEQYDALSKSPLAVRVEVPKDSPETRETAFKMRIKELFLGSARKEILAEEKSVEDAERRLTPFRDLLSRPKSDTRTWTNVQRGDEERQLYSDFVDAIQKLRQSTRHVDEVDRGREALKAVLEKELTPFEGALKQSKKSLRATQLRFETNNLMIDTLLSEAQNDTELETAFEEMTRAKKEVSSQTGSYSYPGHTLKDAQQKMSPLAQKILDGFILFGQEIPFSSDKRMTLFDQLRGWAPSRDHQQAGTEYRGRFPQQRWESDPAFAHLINIQKANKKILENPFDTTGMPWGDTAREKAGWKITAEGAAVPPEGSSREANRQLREALERLSTPTSVKEIFDVKGEQGDLKIFTQDQAVDLLMRTRREGQRFVYESNALGIRLESTVTMLETATDAYAKLDDKKKALERERDKARGEVSDLTVAGKEKDAQLGTLREVAIKENTALSKRLQGIQKALQTALEEKGGLLGGDKKLRSAVEKALAQLKG